MTTPPARLPADDDPPEVPGPLAAPVAWLLLLLAVALACCAEIVAGLARAGEARRSEEPRRPARPSLSDDAA